MHRLIALSKILVLAIVLVSSIVACRPINPEKCSTTDWYQSGLKDGQNGRHDRLDAFADTCASVGVVPDAASYRKGRADGLVQFCTFETGLKYGQRGHRNPAGLCLPAAQHFVSYGWTFGDTLRRVENDIDNVGVQMSEVRALLESADTPNEDRARLWAEYDRLERERERLSSHRAQVFQMINDYRHSLTINAVQDDGSTG